MNRKQKRMLARIIAALIVLIAAVLAPLNFPYDLVLFLVPYFLVGWDVLWRAIRNISHGSVFDENFLMSIATIGALCLGDYTEAVAVMLFFQVGELFQSYAVERSRKSIVSLMDIRPDYANVLRNGETLEVDPEEVAIDEFILVRPGERVPLDGIVTEGTSAVDTSALTGESLPRNVRPGDEIISGCVNNSGVITVKVTKEFGESTVAKILDLVENASSKKAKAENFITKFARYYTPLVVFAAIALAVIPPLIIGGHWGEWIERALIFLVISCPCALVISVPLSFFGGIGGASKQGILVKGGNYLEALSQTETVIFDKTGTLTQGTFSVTAIHPELVDEKELLAIAAAAESYSTHPISTSLQAAHGKDIPEGSVKNVAEISGHGVKGKINGHTVYVGNGKLMDKAGVKWRECSHAGTIVHVAMDGKYMGHIVISDIIKEDAEKAIQNLKDLGIKRTVMLTGDRKAVGEKVAQDLGLDEVHTELLPGDKVAQVDKLIKEKSPKTKLAFVGDGINDAPVLAGADIGIAMGALGSDAAIEAADIVLMDDKPSKIATAIKISRKTMAIVKQNIVFALAVKGVILALGAVGLATMWEAVFADVGNHIAYAHHTPLKRCGAKCFNRALINVARFHAIVECLKGGHAANFEYLLGKFAIVAKNAIKCL
ncbi:MAG: heavy metal translocating P-type ATPase [Bacillota bacterium]|nr:heavy metal translocating P-type ATPase [Bacillota bacterium]